MRIEIISKTYPHTPLYNGNSALHTISRFLLLLKDVGICRRLNIHIDAEYDEDGIGTEWIEGYMYTWDE